MYITQGENTGISHVGTYAIDFVGWNGSSQVNLYPYYAPFDCTLIAIWGSTSPMLVWQSNNEVNFVDGTLDYITLNVVHDDRNTDHHTGQLVSQGALLGYTGTNGQATGDHVHINVAKGLNNYQYQNQYGNYMFTNSYHIYDAMGVNNTIIVEGYGYNWRDFQDFHLLTHKSKFPWVLYARKLRTKHK